MKYVKVWKKVKADFDFEAFREEAEKHYIERFPNVKPEERRKLIDYAIEGMRQNYTPEYRYI